MKKLLSVLTAALLGSSLLLANPYHRYHRRHYHHHRHHDNGPHVVIRLP